MIRVNINNTPLVASELPKKHIRANGTFVDGYDKCTNFHYEDGFRDVVLPKITETQELGELIIVDDTVTYTVVDKQVIEPTSESTKKRIISAYENVHTPNGKQAYNDYRADVIIDLYDAKITQAQANEIEFVLRKAFDLIAIHGNWVGGLNELNKLENLENYIQPYYDQAVAIFELYIQENFNK